MGIVSICRPLEPVLELCRGAPGPNFENHCTTVSVVWFASYLIFLHHISLIRSCIPLPRCDTICKILILVQLHWGCPSPHALLQL